MKVYPVNGIVIATLVALIVAPLMGWYLIGLLIKIHQLEEKMRSLATYDALTGLLNRRVFLERIDHLFKIAQRDKRDFSVIVVDLDHFKEINDQYGHANGDSALASFGKAVKATIRESDPVCRLGGDEFVFFLPNTSSNHSWFFLERLHAVIREIRFDNLPIRLTASMGLVSFPGVSVNTIDEYINLADKAMYCAKQNGRNQTQIFEYDRV